MNELERRMLIGGAVAATLVANFLLPLLIFGTYRGQGTEMLEFFVPLIAGWYVSEVALLAIWCALGSHALAVRVPLCLTLLLVGFWALTCGIILTDPLPPGVFPVMPLFYMLCMFSYVLIPLLILRKASGERLILAGEIEKPEPGKSFSISYLLGLTALFAVHLAVFRSLMGEGSLDFRVSNLVELVGYSFVPAIYMMPHCYPCIWLLCSHRREVNSTAAIVLFAGWLGPVLLLAVFVAVVSGGQVRGSDFGLLMGTALLFGMGLAAGTALGMYVLRSAGYRLHSDPAPEAASCDSARA